jgi:hypothetical protein
VHTTPEQCLMSITAIARQAQGIRAGEIIAKLAEDAYFCASTTGSTSLLPPGTATTRLQVAAPATAPTVLELSSQLNPTALAPTPADVHRAATATATSSPTVPQPAAEATILTAAAATAEAQTMEPTGGPAAAAVAAAEAT